MRAMALDVGKKAIGVAISDPLGWAPSILKAIRRKTLRTDIESVTALVSEYEVTDLVVGYPLNMDGTAGEAARRIDRFIEQLGRACSTPIHRIDERLSTREALEMISERRIPKNQRRRRRDEFAAAQILQRFLRKEPVID